MDKKNKIKIDLFNFLTTGEFAGIEIGFSKNEILELFPEPDCWQNGKNMWNSPIWRYGNFDLMFDDERCLEMIFNDYILEMEGGENIDLENCFFNEKSNYSIEQFIEFLKNKNIDFSKKQNVINQQIITISQSGTDIAFDLFDEDERTDMMGDGYYAIAIHNSSKKSGAFK